MYLLFISGLFRNISMYLIAFPHSHICNYLSHLLFAYLGKYLYYSHQHIEVSQLFVCVCVCKFMFIYVFAGEMSLYFGSDPGGRVQMVARTRP